VLPYLSRFSSCGNSEQLLRYEGSLFAIMAILAALSVARTLQWDSRAECLLAISPKQAATLTYRNRVVLSRLI